MHRKCIIINDVIYDLMKILNYQFNDDCELILRMTYMHRLSNFKYIVFIDEILRSPILKFTFEFEFAVTNLVI